MADFKFYLNRQGPKGEPGAKGEKGDNGNTPTFSDGINTPTVYTMQIDMGDGNVFETQNLKYPMRDDGGNYLRYDRTNSTVTLSAPNIADLQRTSGEVTLASVSDVKNEDTQDTDAVSMELRNADQLALSNEINRINGNINTVDTKVNGEIQNRQNADTALGGKIDGLDSSKANKTDVYTKTQTDALLNGKANTVHTHNLSQITDAGSLAGKNTVDYGTEVTNKPTIGNGTITITQGGVTKGTFTANQSSNSTIELDAGGGGGTTYTEGDAIDLTNNIISVKYDNNTLKLNGSGQLYADIPAANNATITITQGGVTKGTFTTNQSVNGTIALDTGITYTSGKAIKIDQNDAINLKTSIINAPLVYQDETGTDVKFQNRNVSRYNGSFDGSGYNDSSWSINYGTGTEYLQAPDINFSNLLNSSSTIYAETRLTNGINISGALSKGLNSTDLAYISLLGRYEQDESFTVIAAIGLNTFYNVRTYIRFFNNGNDITGLTTSNYQYNSNGDMYGTGGAKYYSINCSSTNLVICSMSSTDGSTANSSSKNTVTIPSQLKNALDTVTHIRVYPVNYNDNNNYVTLDESFLKVINPIEDVTAGDGQTRLTTFKNGNNIFEAIPEAIKLKYDSSTLGVNASNELTVPTATSSTLGLVKPDDNTIIVDANGTISANTPIATSSSTGTVQPDNSTITVDSNGIISAVNNGIAKTAPIIPLKYEEQEDGVSVGIGGTLNHTNYTSSADEVWVYDVSVASIYTSNGGNFSQTATNMMSKIFYKGYKIRLDNGLNIAWNIAKAGEFFMNVAVGYYNNETFVPVLYALNSNSYGGLMFARPAMELGSDIYNIGQLNTQFEGCVGISLAGDILSAFSPSAGRRTYNISDATLLTEFRKCTHAICTVVNKSTSTTFDYSTGKFANPETSLSADLEVRNTIFSAAENLILNNKVTVIPELKLNYDSNTLGVNSNNKLTVPTATSNTLGLVKPDGTTITINDGVISAAGSAPSNMVTTNTSQIILNQKTFKTSDTSYMPYVRITPFSDSGNNSDFIAISDGAYSNPTGICLGYQFNDPKVTVWGSNSNANRASFTYNGIHRNGSSTDSFTFWANESRNSKIILKNYQDIILDSSMLDGTYLTWDSTTNKITVDIQALKDAIDALGT